MVTEAVVKTEHNDGIAAFGLGTSDTAHSASFDFCDLSNHSTNGTAGSRNNDRVTIARLTNVEQACVRSQSRHTEHAQRR